MNIYVAKFTLYEGEHTHSGAFLLHAASHDEAYALAKTQEHEAESPEDNDAELTYWDYGDGTTASRLNGVVEITEEEAKVIRRFDFAFDFN